MVKKTKHKPKKFEVNSTLVPLALLILFIIGLLQLHNIENVPRNYAGEAFSIGLRDRKGLLQADCPPNWNCGDNTCTPEEKYYDPNAYPDCPYTFCEWDCGTELCALFGGVAACLPSWGEPFPYGRNWPYGYDFNGGAYDIPNATCTSGSENPDYAQIFPTSKGQCCYILCERCVIQNNEVVEDNIFNNEEVDWDPTAAYGPDCRGPNCYPCTCDDGIKNRDEVDTDCGGTFCTDCCENGIWNPAIGEEDVDCGGPCPDCCENGLQGGNEDGIDCGGDCIPCCENGVWNPEAGEEDVDCGEPCIDCCHNGIQNSQEMHVDCGGPCPDCCENGRKDLNEMGIDCGGNCPYACHCFDDVMDFDEEEIDCGGEECPPCDSAGSPVFIKDDEIITDPEGPEDIIGDPTLK